MTRAHLLPVLAALLLFAGCGRGAETPAAAARKPPAIVLVSIDTLRADRLPAYGATSGLETPAFDRLAADGVLFENAYAHVPLTLPSHANVLTGRLPFETGVRSNIGYRLDTEAGATLPELLAEAGYATGAAVSAYVLRAETGLGPLFDFYDDSLEVWEAATLGAVQRPGEETARAALGWIDATRHREPQKPFFLLLHLFEPHSPYEPAPPFRGRYEDPYDGEIATVDAILGRFLTALEERDLYDESLIVVTSDHGEGLGDHGEAEHGVLLYREALHVPLIVKLPGGRLGGRRVAAPAQLVDLLPTITAVAGVEAPEDLPGSSLIDLAAGEVDERAIYSETLYPRLHLGWSELRSLATERFHYIEGPDPELFDIVADPGETRNVRTARRRELRALADQLDEIPLNLEAAGSADPEEMARLAALGYLSAAAPEGDGPRRNPRDHIEVLGRIQRIFTLNQQGRHRDGAELAREILRDYPDLVDVYNLLGHTLRKLGDLEEALAAHQEAIRRSPQLVDSLALEVGKLELDLGNLEAAELNARQAMALDPAAAHLLLAGVAVAREEWAAAERAARQAMGDAERPRVPALILLARVLVEQGRLPEALAAADRATARIAEEGARPVRTLASTRGDILARMGKVEEAEAAFREEIARFPTTSEAYLQLAILLASQRRFAEIEPTLEAMVEASPRPATYRLAAQAMADLGNQQGAREYARRGAELTRRESPGAP